MRFVLLLLLSLGTASADVLVYRGTSIESRPGVMSNIAHVFFAYDTAAGRASLLTRSEQFNILVAEATLERETIADSNGGSFLVLHSSVNTEFAEIRWQLASNSFFGLTPAPRLLSGHFSVITYEFVSNPPSSRRVPPTFSEKKLTFRLDRQRTEVIEKAHYSFDQAVHSLLSTR